MKKLLALILALVMCFSLVACGGDKAEEAKPAESNKPAESGKPSSEGNGATTPADPEVEYKKEIIFTETSSAFEHPDPQKNTALQNSKNHLLTHERLVRINPETKELEPMLATKWEVSADSLTYTFHLRDDVVFHNGEKMTADDVVFTWERGREAPTANVKAQYGLTVYEAVDDYTVKATLEAPNADFLMSRAAAGMGILNREACEADPDKGAWIGTGLWILDKHDAQSGSTWVRNDNYWGETTPTERLTQRVIPEAATRVIALENGEIDVARVIPNLSVADVEANSDLGLYRVASTMCHYVGFNNKKDGPWNDINFRKALAYAIDYDALILAMYNGEADQAKTFWGNVDMYGYAPTEGYHHDLELAKEYLAKSDYAGETITMVCYGATYGKAGVVMADAFSKIGVNLEVNQAEAAAYTPALQSGEWDLNCYTYSFPVTGDGINNFLASISGSHSIIGTPHEDKINQLAADGLVTTDDAARKAIYAELQELWMEDVVNIPLMHSYNYGAFAKGLTGVTWVNSGEHDYRYIKMPLE